MQDLKLKDQMTGNENAGPVGYSNETMLIVDNYAIILSVLNQLKLRYRANNCCIETLQRSARIQIVHTPKCPK